MKSKNKMEQILFAEQIFSLNQEDLKCYLKDEIKRSGYSPISARGYLYAEGEIPILLVAHLDTVHKKQPQMFYYTKDLSKVCSPQGIGGDDRCGVMIILDIIKKHKCSVLFCEDEEIGGGGAYDFVDDYGDIDIGVNFALEFDRRGENDCVFYKKSNKHFVEHIESFGFKTASGTFSDISVLATGLKIEAVNLSSGYYLEHTTDEYVDFGVMDSVKKRAMNIISSGIYDFEYVEDVQMFSYYGNRYEDDSDLSMYYLCGDFKIMLNGKLKYHANEIWIGEDDNIMFADGKYIEQQDGYYALFSENDEMVLHSDGLYNDYYESDEIISYCIDCGEPILASSGKNSIERELCPACLQYYKAQYGIDVCD